VFQAIMDGDQNATSAFMTGELSINGDMGTALKLARNLQ
jgi:putative sterol carrier protein